MPETDSVSADYSVQISQLSSESQEVVHEAIDFATASHSLESLDVRAGIHDAEQADLHRAQAEDYQREQSLAAHDGNWERAAELAQKAQGELEAVADHGGSDVPAAQAESDVASLENARWEQRMANENAHAAASYGERGDTATAQLYESAAEGHQSQADDAGHDGTSSAHEATHESSETAAPEHAPDVDAAGVGVSETPTSSE